MSGELNQSFLIKKAFEISYAIFRVSSQLKQAAFKDELEGWAVRILSSVISEDYEKSKKSTEVVEYLLKLGAEVGLVNPNNTQVITNEAKILNSAIAEFARKEAKVAEIDLTGVFSENLPKEKEWAEKNKKTALVGNSLPVSNGNSSLNTAMNAAMRQSAILERIRQKDNCRLKEIQEFLPEVSERTLRYDLQSLMEQSLIERVGNGGPSTYYRLKSEKSQLSSENTKENAEPNNGGFISKENLLYSTQKI